MLTHPYDDLRRNKKEMEEVRKQISAILKDDSLTDMEKILRGYEKLRVFRRCVELHRAILQEMKDHNEEIEGYLKKITC